MEQCETTRAEENQSDSAQTCTAVLFKYGIPMNNLDILQTWDIYRVSIWFFILWFHAFTNDRVKIFLMSSQSK